MSGFAADRSEQEWRQNEVYNFVFVVRMISKSGHVDIQNAALGYLNIDWKRCVDILFLYYLMY